MPEEKQQILDAAKSRATMDQEKQQILDVVKSRFANVDRYDLPTARVVETIPSSLGSLNRVDLKRKNGSNKTVYVLVPGYDKSTGMRQGTIEVFDRAERLIPILSKTATPSISDSIDRLGNADPKDVQQIAASQIQLLAGYHEIVLAQSRRSFFWALVGSGIGLALFSVAVVVSTLNGIALASIVPLISGSVVELVSGIVFYLYGRTAAQLSTFHNRLEALQRYLLANSICEVLDGDERNKARVALIKEISRTNPVSVQMPLSCRSSQPNKWGGIFTA
jgi:hypothetical protein